ncbi:hypothetical protein O6H91_06G087300 [Diphasiastrum complanatum]|uniref:Uncharacterized protein n=1 Tax=Diphasiastrum complanatum TaxID=34168 RepID=A0ACC2DFX9_DIPCM|nr:hypothetical protein O6H91_06G087300 [Diphasiastrum complanatum]
MFGGGIRKDDGLPAISSTNIFAALESRRRKSSKKMAEKDKSSFKPEQQHHNGGEVAQFWAPASVTVNKSWADVEEDDDDYYATTAPPPSWNSVKPTDDAPLHKEQLSDGEETEADEELEEEVEDDADEEIEVKASNAISIDSAGQSQTTPSTPAVREPDRQLSKKEIKKKELAELDAVLAELGLYNTNDEVLAGAGLTAEEKVDVKADDNGETEQKGATPLLTESKSSKRRKPKKEKSFKEGKNGDISLMADLESGGKDEVNGLQDGEPSTVSADPKEVLKKLASLKKKKSMKDSDAAAKAAAAEASARAAKLAAAKKKEKHHYNQQPVR